MDDKEVSKTIRCKYVHENQYFIASNQTLWPCCFLWSESTQSPALINERLNKINGENWNSLKHHSIDDILNHKWYTTELKNSWNPEHPQFIYRCFTDCSFNRVNDNTLKEDNNE